HASRSALAIPPGLTEPRHELPGPPQMCQEGRTQETTCHCEWSRLPSGLRLRPPPEVGPAHVSSGRLPRGTHEGRVPTHRSDPPPPQSEPEGPRFHPLAPWQGR